MPIKFPKGFPRRKSSGNVLEDVPTEGPSFVVLSRPGSSGAALGATRLQPQHQTSYTSSRPSYEDENEDLFSVLRPDGTNRGSAGTHQSTDTAQNNSAASSTRMSSSSTNPSSIDARSDKHNNMVTSQRGQHDGQGQQNGSRGGFLRNAGRTFSFGNIKRNHDINDLPPPPVPQKTPVSSVRDRSMTISSVTTATPPRLEETDLSLDSSGLDGFGDMFDGIGSKSSRDPSPNRRNVHAPSPVTQLRPGPLLNVRNGVPRQVLREQNRELESSPFSLASNHSNDELMRSPSPSKTTLPNNLYTTKTQSPYPAGSVLSRSESANTEDNLFEDTPLQQSRSKPSSARPPPSSFPATMARERGYSQAGSVIKSPISERSSMEVPAIDPALVANADLATRYEKEKAKPPIALSKIMTPAQFERYKLQKEETRKYNKVFGKEESDDSGDNYEDDDEDEADREREKKALKQRKKQEAHLAVYRQQMIKVTGDTSPREAPEEQPTSPGAHAGPSPTGMLDIPGLGKRMSTFTVDGKFSSVSNGKSSSNEEEEDEDVPLGILAAHGFPNRNRPPSKLIGSNSNPNLRALSQLQTGNPGPAPSEAANRGSLPAFARNLPQDPYYGASIVNPSYRESLAFNKNSAAMSSNQNLTVPQASGAATAHPLHPAGLVGVIAGEERARAARRGSPNAQGNYDLPPSMQPPPHLQRASMYGNYGGMGNMSTPDLLSPTDQAQLQMSQQMTQMMQMQMQWMQQMMQMSGSPQQGMPPMQFPPGMPMAPGMQSPARPQSVPLQNYGDPLSRQQRTMSTLTPSMANWSHSTPAIPQLGSTLNGQYASSIAPSERSNVGMASRYRPVSIVQPEPEPEPRWQRRASTFTSSTFRPLSQFGAGFRNVGRPLSTIRPVQSGNDDDDDEQGWAEMKAKKEKKQKSWKLRKGNNTLKELYNTPA